MEVKIKDWVIKKCVKDGWYLVATSPASKNGWGDVMMKKEQIQAELGIDEKELDEILKQVE